MTYTLGIMVMKEKAIDLFENDSAHFLVFTKEA
jgi:hypothetical protein